MALKQTLHVPQETHFPSTGQVLTGQDGTQPLLIRNPEVQLVQVVPNNEQVAQGGVQG